MEGGDVHKLHLSPYPNQRILWSFVYFVQPIVCSVELNMLHEFISLLSLLHLVAGTVFLWYRYNLINILPPTWFFGRHHSSIQLWGCVYIMCWLSVHYSHHDCIFPRDKEPIVLRNEKGKIIDRVRTIYQNDDESTNKQNNKNINMIKQLLREYGRVNISSHIKVGLSPYLPNLQAPAINQFTRIWSETAAAQTGVRKYNKVFIIIAEFLLCIQRNK